MTSSQESSNTEKIINTVMGVKTENINQNTPPQIATTQELDIKTTLVYKLGTILQIGVMILTLVGMEKLLGFIDINFSFPSWTNTLLAGLFFTLLSIRSRIFSPLDNTRSRRTYEEIVRPKWAPPSFVFPIVWMAIAVLRVISSLMVWQQMQQQFLVLPLIVFVIHLALGDTWNTIFTVERRLGAAVPVVILGPCLSAFIVSFVYWQTNPTAGIIITPSCVWLTVAALLVFRIWQLNGSEPLYPLKRQPIN